jgi:hypothetical protein
VAQYIHRFRELQLALGPYAPDEAASLHRFLKGLAGTVRMYTTMAMPKTLQEAFTLAERCDAT